MSKHRLGLFLAAAGAICFGIGGTLSNILFTRITVSPQWVVSARMLFSGLLILGYLLCRRENIFSIWHQKRDVFGVLLFGIFGVLFAQATFLQAVFYGNAAVATILQSLGPALIVIILSVALRQVPRRNEAIAILISLIGVFLVVTNGDLHQLDVPVQAFVWGLISVIGVAAYTLLPRPLLARHSSLIVVGWGLLIGGIVANFVAPVWQLPKDFGGVELLLVIGVVLIGTMGAYACYVASLNYLQPAIVSMLGLFEPLTATILAVLFLGVQFRGFQIIGVILALFSIILINFPLPKKHRSL